MPVGVQCPISSSLGEFPSYWDGLALVSWAFARIGVHRPSLRLPYLMCSVRSYLPLDFNRVTSLRPTYRHSFGRPSTYSLFRWVSRLGTGSGTRCCGSTGGISSAFQRWAAEFFKFCRWKLRALLIWQSHQDEFYGLPRAPILVNNEAIR